MTNYGRDYRHKRAVGVFPSREATEDALHQLRETGFDMGRVSVIARDADGNNRIADAEVHHQNIGNKADEGAAAGAATGGALGTIAGLFVGLGALAIPGVGPIMFAGAEATALATTLAGTAIGAAAGGLVGALIGLGIPEDRARVYGDRVSQGDYLVMVTGSDADLRRVEPILVNRGIEEWDIYQIAPEERVNTVERMENAEVIYKNQAGSHPQIPATPTTVDYTEPEETVERDRDVVDNNRLVEIVDRRDETYRR
ncbi:MAG: general stress protein [Oscillatoria sp. PMC 1051.18]|nr:general stress protein [Oscillatoria sp. PMC 1050.18]MEC5030662.1 general stress protein [Oscillatoria sp. PMC 1051.18]